MKKAFIILTLSILLTNSAISQVNFGVKGGINFSGFLFENIEFIPSDYAGIFIDIPPEENWRVSFELNHVVRGGILRSLKYVKYPPANRADLIDLYAKKDYLEFAFLLQFDPEISIETKDKYPYFGLSISTPLPFRSEEPDKSKTESVGVVRSDTPMYGDAHFAGDYKRGNSIVGMIAGYSIAYKNGITVDIRYCQSINSMGSASSIIPINQLHSSFNFSMKFKLNR
ncbi:hypothetical protein ACFL67_00450 [candidate division KSB1 bacterium]